VYEDCAWVDQHSLRNAIWDPRTPPDVARRFYLNQPTAADDAWTTQMLWKAIEDTSKVVELGASIVAFFDGSKSSDATALVGCRMSDGHVFLIASWEPLALGHDVPVEEVDAAVAKMFDDYDVCGFYADVAEWESFVKVSWPADHYDARKRSQRVLIEAQKAGKDAQVFAWDMRSRDFEFTKACELTAAEIVERKFTHDGNPVLTRHVENMRRRPNKWGVSVRKESRSSSKKIDAGVCMIGARMLRLQVLATGDWPRKGRGGGRVIVLS
jgi:phage terminase large subunit-like protein